MITTRLMSAAAAGLLLCAGVAMADTVNWDFDVTTSGNDVFFNPATPVNPNAVQYDATMEITLVEVGATWNGIPLGVLDVTDQVPPENLVTMESVAGPAPVAVIDSMIQYPEPPEPAGITATLFAEIDAAGFGHGSVTEVTLGNVTTNVPPFGDITVTVTSVRVVGQLQVTEVFAPGDVDESGEVNLFDLLDMLDAWGACDKPCPPSCPADITNADGTGTDCEVNLFDLLMLLDNWG